jgi:hypothetical protein
MSILDDAIREHLELKRQHGAPDDEVKKLEDEAFGPPARPDQVDPLAEAPTEFMMTPETGGDVAPDAGEQASVEGRAAPNIADLQEAPPPAAPEPSAEEEQPAAEHEAIDDSAAGHTTQERHAIAEQPTEMFDVESEIADSAADASPFPEPEAPAAAAEPAPSDEELLDSELLQEPRLPAGVDPATPVPDAAAATPAFDEEDDFFDEQRLSEELDQALAAPAPTEEHALPAEEPISEELEPPSEELEPVSDEHEHEPISGEHEAVSEEHEQPVAEGPASEEHDVAAGHGEGHEDVLEDTPDFLEESPEDDQLWFEQKPPKDFDFDD